MLILGVAAIILVLVLSRKSDDSPKAPPASPFKWIFGIAALLSWAAAGWLILSAANGTVWNGFVFVVFAFVFFGSGIALFKAASQADQKHADNMRARADRTEHHTRHEKGKIDLQNAKANAEREQRIREEEARTREAALEYERKLTELKQDYIGEARLRGLDVESYVLVKMREAEKAADFEDFMRREQVRIQTEAILIQQQIDAANQIDRNRIKAELNAELRRLIGERREVEKNEADKKLRKQYLASYDAEIKAVKDELKRAENYNGQTDRFFQTANRQETKRVG